jgi:hypothetical protein
MSWFLISQRPLQPKPGGVSRMREPVALLARWEMPKDTKPNCWDFLGLDDLLNRKVDVAYLRLLL